MYAGALLLVVGVLAWITGRPLIFPSLGPSALVIAVAPESEAVDGRRFVGSHLIGVLVGLGCYHVLVGAGSIQGIEAAFTLEQGRLALSGVLSVVLTSLVMHETDTLHSPACATTLIVSLGLLPGLDDGATILAAVILVYLVHAASRHLKVLGAS